LNQKQADQRLSQAYGQGYDRATQPDANEIKRCPVSGSSVRAAFPADVEAPVQYNPRFRGLMLYLSNQQILPFDRLRQT
jgi:hypothetical protein